jgi:hypothetical protein
VFFTAQRRLAARHLSCPGRAGGRICFTVRTLRAVGSNKRRDAAAVALARKAACQIRPRRRSFQFFRAAPRNAAIGTEPTGSKFFEAVTKPVKRLDHIERIVDSPQLPAQSFDVAVDGAIIDVALLVIRRVH